MNTAPCECPDFAPTVTVTVTDASSGAAVPAPVFTVDGNPASGSCVQSTPVDSGAADAGATLCEQWRVQLPVGHSTFTVSAPGYQTQSFAYDTQMSGGCCSSGTQLTQAVALSP